MKIKRGEDVGVLLKNQTDSRRTEEEMDRLWQAINDAIEPFDFRVHCIGSREALRRVLCGSKS